MCDIASATACVPCDCFNATVLSATRRVLYYARAVDSTLLVALSTVASKQSQGTQAVAEAMSQVLDYCATHPDATIRYKSSDMILAIHSDASYLSVTKAQSRAGGHFFPNKQENKRRFLQKQWSNTVQCNDHQKNHVFRGRSRSRRNIQQCARDNTDTQHAHRNESSTTANANSNRQLDSIRNH